MPQEEAGIKSKNALDRFNPRHFYYYILEKINL